jgi:hypothetical protein
VDFVSDEAAIAGKSAAEYVSGRTKEKVRSVSLTTGRGVRYTVPERIDLYEANEPVKVFFRVTDVFKNIRLIIESESGEIAVKKAKKNAAPGEMESLDIPAAFLDKLAAGTDNTLKVYLEDMEVKK